MLNAIDHVSVELIHWNRGDAIYVLEAGSCSGVSLSVAIYENPMMTCWSCVGLPYPEKYLFLKWNFHNDGSWMM